jgi:hypothetical protein
MSTANKESKDFSKDVLPEEESNLDSMKEVESMQNRGVSSQRISNYLFDMARRDGWLLKDFNEDMMPTERTPNLRRAYYVILILSDSIGMGRNFSISDVFHTINRFAPLEEFQTADEGHEFRDNALGAHELAKLIKNQLNGNQELSSFKQMIMVEGTEIHTALETLAGDGYEFPFIAFQSEIVPEYLFLLDTMFNISIMSLRLSL